MISFKRFILIFFLFCSPLLLSAQNHSENKTQDYQIFLKSPAKEIKLLMYEKNFVPVQGVLSEDKKSIIIKNYQTGSKVHVKVLYEDGTTDEFVKSPCFIDPVV